LRTQVAITGEFFERNGHVAHGLVGIAGWNFESALLIDVQPRAPQVEADDGFARCHRLYHDQAAPVTQAGEEKNVTGAHAGQQTFARHPAFNARLLLDT